MWYRGWVVGHMSFNASLSRTLELRAIARRHADMLMNKGFGAYSAAVLAENVTCFLRVILLEVRTK